MTTPAHYEPDPVESARPSGDTSGHAPEAEALRALVWPRRGTASIGLTALLCVALGLPALLQTADVLLVAVLFAPLLLLGYVTRLAFEALLPSGRQALPARVAAAATATAIGIALEAACAAVLAISLDLTWVLIAGTASCALLLTAAAVRNLELRMGTVNRRIMFVGGAPQLQDLRREIGRRGDLSLAGSLSIEIARALDDGALLERLERPRPTTLVMSAQAIRDQRLVAAAATSHARGVRIRELSEFYEQEFRKVAVSELSPAWFLFDVAAIHDHRLYGGAKRVIETVIAGVVMLVTAPLLPVLALAVRLSGPGPILFHQIRVGRNGEHFRMTKFRTMSPAESQDAPSWASADVHRITPVGRVMRRFRVDELPQLWGVARGDLALVGPRPEQPAIVDRLERELRFYSARHCVRPGLTGWAQVNHGYGGTMPDVIEKLQYEFFYIKHQGVLLDLRVMVASIRTVLSGRGA